MRKIHSKVEMSELGWEVIHRLSKSTTQAETKESGGKMVHTLIETVS